MAQGDYLVFRTGKIDASAADVERWAAERGHIVANVRRIADNVEIEFEGQAIRPDACTSIWTADIVISEGIEG
jgi:hypothetical protein